MHGWPRASFAALVVVLGLVAGCADGPARTAAGGPAMPTPAGSTAAPVPLPKRIVTTPDLPGTGWRLSRPATYDAAAEWPWALRGCPLIDPASYPAQKHREQVRREVYRRPGGEFVAVLVERFAAGWAADSLGDLRAAVQACSRYETADSKASHTVLRDGFAGDESMLIESSRITPPDEAKLSHSAIIRRGDTVVTVVGTGLDSEPLVALASAVTARLS